MRAESTDGSSPGLLHPYVVGAAALAALGVWLTLPAWGHAPPAGDDIAAHIVRADHAFDNIFSRGRLDGWFSELMTGYQEFLFYGPGFTWLVGLLRALTLGFLSTTGAVKVAGAAGFVATAPAVTFLARGLGLRKSTAVAAGLLALAVNSPFGPGLHSVYVVGLLPHQIAAALFGVAVGASAWTVRSPSRKWPLLAGGAFAVLAVTHVITAGIAAVFVALIVTAQLASGEATAGWWRRLAAGALVAAGLAAFWALPFLAHQDLQGPITAWRTPTLLERVRDIVTGDLLFPPLLGLLVPVAIVATIGLAARFYALLSLLPIVYLAGAHAIFSAASAHAVAIQLPNRGVGYAGYFALLPVAIALDVGVSRAGERLRPLASKGVPAVAVVVAAGGAVGFTWPARDAVAERDKPRDAFAAAATAVRREVTPSGRFAVERDFPREISIAGFSHPDLWLAEMSGRRSLNIFNPESSYARAAFASEEIGRQPVAVLTPKLLRAGVSHVVTIRPATEHALERAGYRRVWRRGDFALFETPLAGRVGPFYATGIDGNVTLAMPEHVAAGVTLSSAGRVTAAISWSPKWHVFVDGDQVPARPSDDEGLLEFRLPAGRSEVELQFRRDRWDWIGGAVTALTLAGLLAYCLPSSISSLMSRRRSRTA